MRRRLECVCRWSRDRHTVDENERIWNSDDQIQRLLEGRERDCVLERSTEGSNQRQQWSIGDHYVSAQEAARLAPSHCLRTTRDPNRKIKPHTHTHTHTLSHALLYRTHPHPPSHSLTTCSIAFKDGDTLSFKDTGINGVLQILSTTYQCGGTASSPIRCLN